MNNQAKQSVINTYAELFLRGEILKAQYFINNCVPALLQDDEVIKTIREECNAHIDQIKKWNASGRPYPGTYATVDFNSFPKFVLARKKIRERYSLGSILDVGCYSGVFLKEMAEDNFRCYGIDIHKELMDILNKEQDKVKFTFGSVENIPYNAEESDTFDIVTAFDVIEHVVDLNRAMKEIENVCVHGGMIIINVPRMEEGYKDESFEHMRMFSDSDIQNIWGNKRDFKFELCNDEFGRPTSFITYTNG